MGTCPRPPARHRRPANVVWSDSATSALRPATSLRLVQLSASIRLRPLPLARCTHARHSEPSTPGTRLPPSQALPCARPPSPWALLPHTRACVWFAWPTCQATCSTCGPMCKDAAPISSNPSTPHAPRRSAINACASLSPRHPPHVVPYRRRCGGARKPPAGVGLEGRTTPHVTV